MLRQVDTDNLFDSFMNYIVFRFEYH